MLVCVCLGLLLAFSGLLSRLLTVVIFAKYQLLYIYIYNFVEVPQQQPNFSLALPLPVCAGVGAGSAVAAGRLADGGGTAQSSKP